VHRRPEASRSTQDPTEPGCADDRGAAPDPARASGPWPGSRPATAVATRRSVGTSPWTRGSSMRTRSTRTNTTTTTTTGRPDHARPRPGGPARSSSRALQLVHRGVARRSRKRPAVGLPNGTRPRRTPRLPGGGPPPAGWSTPSGARAQSAQRGHLTPHRARSARVCRAGGLTLEGVVATPVYGGRPPAT
jgi:hypothetical protein